MDAMPLHSFCSKLTIVFSVAAGLLVATSIFAADRDAQLVQAGERQITISYRLTDFQLRQLRINGEIANAHFDNAISLNVAGVPELPTRVFIVGVPPGAQAKSRSFRAPAKKCRTFMFRRCR
jgi:hypothetical protein